MNGILVINKEKDMTSRDVVNKLNKLFNTKQIGHTGTLDPIAEGVLVTCIGNSTKLVELLTNSTKEYIATIKLGITTDTYDITGNIIATSSNQITEEQIKTCLTSFIGESIQEVPIYSAVKVNGKKLYEYARNNIAVDLPKRTITIYEIELLNFTGDTIEFRCLVSKGTYIRSLIKDICEKLNVCGTMNNLIRTKQGDFTLDDSYKLADVASGNYRLLTNSEVLKNFEHLELTSEEYQRVKNGAIINKKFKKDLAVLTYNNEIIAIYQTYYRDSTLAKPYKMLLNS